MYERCKIGEKINGLSRVTGCQKTWYAIPTGSERFGEQVKENCKM